MWNLMHVMQVIAYLRLLVQWPANANMMLQSLHNALTLENIINNLYDKYHDSYDGQNNEDIESLQGYGISYQNIYLSLGIFGIALSLLVFGVMFYAILKFFAERIRICHPIINFLRLKLFYSGWIRYLIASNLTMTHNCIFYLYITGSF